MRLIRSQLELGWTIAWVVILAGCKPMTAEYDNPDRGSQVFHVIHPNDIKPLSRYDHEYMTVYRKGINASALIMLTLDTGRRFCSGFIYEINGPEIGILSNHHCFSQTDSAGAAAFELLDGACARTKVFFNTTEGSENELTTVRCIEGTLDTDYRADIASFKAISANGRLPAGIESLTVASADNTDFATEAYIVHHPLNVAYLRYKGNTIPGATITESDCQIIGEYVATEEWESNPVLAMSFKHTCDLSKGSSGSALIAKASHEVIGLNWGGVKTVKKQGSSSQELDVSNAAIKPSCIHGFLHDRANLEGCVNDPLFSRSFVSSRSSDMLRNNNVRSGNNSWLGCSSTAQAAPAGALWLSAYHHRPVSWWWMMVWLLVPFMIPLIQFKVISRLLNLT